MRKDPAFSVGQCINDFRDPLEDKSLAEMRLSGDTQTICDVCHGRERDSTAVVWKKC